jgi:curved DNA-binding protein CbpA
MGEPYQTLGLVSGCGDEVIRRRYLELVRAHPPEREPERFAAIRSAYDALRDPETRLRNALFEPRSDQSLGLIIAELRDNLRGARIPVDRLLALAEKS